MSTDTTDAQFRVQLLALLAENNDLLRTMIANGAAEAAKAENAMASMGGLLGMVKGLAG